MKLTKLSCLILLTLGLTPFVYAETTFFDQDDSFIIGNVASESSTSNGGGNDDSIVTVIYDNESIVIDNLGKNNFFNVELNNNPLFLSLLLIGMGVIILFLLILLPKVIK